MQSRRNNRIDKKKCHPISVSLYRRYRFRYFAWNILIINHYANSRRTRDK